MAHTELLFPPRLLPVLEDLRGEHWQKLVAEVRMRPMGDLERRALILLIARLAGCLSCQSDSWRAHQGCEQCSKQTIKKFRGTDEELIALFQETLEEIRDILSVELAENQK